jgi:hypothetical protein
VTRKRPIKSKRSDRRDGISNEMREHGISLKTALETLKRNAYFYI